MEQFKAVADAKDLNINGPPRLGGALPDINVEVCLMPMWVTFAPHFVALSLNFVQPAQNQAPL